MARRVCLSLAGVKQFAVEQFATRNEVVGEVASIAAHCSLGAVTTLRSLGSVAPGGLLALDDLAVSKCLGTSIMACRLSTGVVKKGSC